MLRFLLLRFLPRRILPLLTLYELYKMVRYLQGTRVPRQPGRLIVSGDPQATPKPTHREVVSSAATDREGYGTRIQ